MDAYFPQTTIGKTSNSTANLDTSLINIPFSIGNSSERTRSLEELDIDHNTIWREWGRMLSGYRDQTKLAIDMLADALNFFEGKNGARDETMHEVYRYIIKIGHFYDELFAMGKLAVIADRARE